MEFSLETETKRHNDTMKEIRSNGRRLKDLSLQSEEDKRSLLHVQEVNEMLNQKLKSSKRQVEEIEEVANMNLVKYRKLLQEVDDANERADQAENALNKLRSRARTSVSVRRSVPV